MTLQLKETRERVKGWIAIWTMRKYNQVRNQTWDFPITRGTLYLRSYLGTITWQPIPALYALVHHPILRTAVLKDEIKYCLHGINLLETNHGSNGWFKYSLFSFFLYEIVVDDLL